MNNKSDELKLKPRPSQSVPLQIPTDTLNSLQKVALNRDMSVEALMNFYIGQGLRQDVAKLFSEQVLATTAQVLARRISSQDELAAILREIQGEAAV